ncbi:MAG: High potential iron-sulfur protein [Bradymonadales bacterium]|nr:MAG: High potential iron-sulfur protein [Bradymonadales bacterium]
MKASRRTFLTWLGLLPAGFLLFSRKYPVEAAGPLKLDDPTAQALCYRLKTSQVDKSDPRCSRFEPSQNCANCKLYLAAPTAPQGPCQIFQNKIVPAEAWCNAWVPRD